MLDPEAGQLVGYAASDRPQEGIMQAAAGHRDVGNHSLGGEGQVVFFAEGLNRAGHHGVLDSQHVRAPAGDDAQRRDEQWQPGQGCLCHQLLKQNRGLLADAVAVVVHAREGDAGKRAAELVIAHAQHSQLVGNGNARLYGGFEDFHGVIVDLREQGARFR